MADISFQNPESAKLNLAHMTRISSPLKAALPALLAESPDPDSALMRFDRLVSNGAPEVARLLDQNPQLAHYAIVIFGHSHFLGETLLQNPDLLQPLLRPKVFDQNLSHEEFRESLARFRARTSEKDTALVLARFKRREYVRILLRDALRLASLGEVTAEISALSDVLLDEALREAQRNLLARYDSPLHWDENGRAVETPFSILSLGKLGGNELNYSSDIDLMYIFGDGREIPDASISNREFFIRLAQQVTESLSRITSEGSVFRIDLRLRPQGREGELAINLGQALYYYANVAHDWERQALIKVRHSAGDAGLAWQFIQGVQHHVYREGAAREDAATSEAHPAHLSEKRPRLNFAAIKTALVAREKIHKQHHDASFGDKNPGIDVKLESGGIRDIEFLVQCLQRVYGAHEPWLRSGGTLASLHKLHDKHHISSQEFQELTSAYEFLRHIEHRLQLREGRQTHRLPASGPELKIIARSMEGRFGVDRASDFISEVRQRMARVAEIYQQIVYQQQEWEHFGVAPTDFQLHAAAEPSPAERSIGQVLARLSKDAPDLYEVATRQAGSVAHKNLLRFLTSAFTSSERYAGVLRHAEGVKSALLLFETSEYLTDILVRHPEEVASIVGLEQESARTGSGYLFDSPLGAGRAAADPVFAYLAASTANYAEKVALLRRHFRHHAFAAGAKDIVKHRSVYQSLSEMTSAAEDAIAAAWEIAGAPENLAVMVLGRLGSFEFDVLSDADIIFMCEEAQDREALARIASQIVQVLSAYTQEGLVFPTDTRLRPRGREGELLVTPAHLAHYFSGEAHAWEALSYTKFRFVAGSRRLGEHAITACRCLFERFAADTGFAVAVNEMRGKLESADAPAKNFKTSPGGIYDIDFLCSYLLVKHNVTTTGGTLRDRLWRCASLGLLLKSDAAILDHAGELLRTVDHMTRLVTGRAAKWLPVSEHAHAAVEKLSAEMLGREFPSGLEAEIDLTLRDVRTIYEKVMQ